MRYRFDEQLTLLNNELILMGAMCEEAIDACIKYLICGDVSMKEAAIEGEKLIDRKEQEIENICMRLLTLQQPVAGDLRTVSSALKMISDMERIGDQASDIAEIAEYAQKGDLGKTHIADMAQATKRMVTESVDSFVKKDMEKAQDVIKSDDIVDDLFIKVKQELIKAIQNNDGDAEAAVDVGDELKYRMCGLRVERARSLIAEQHARICGKCARDGYSLLLTARKLSGISKRFIGQLDKLKQLTRTLFSIRARHARKAQREADIRKAGTLHEQIKALEYHRYLAAYRAELALTERADVYAVDIDRARCRALKHIDAADERTLARAAHAYDAVDVAVVYGQIYIVQSLDGSVRSFKGL